MSETKTSKPEETPEPGTEGTGVCLTGDEKSKAEQASKPAPADRK